MERVAITGGIGSGKSTASRFLAGRYGLPCIDVDRECGKLLLPGRKGWLAMQARFGSAYFRPDHHLDRARLRRDLFADARLRHEIDRLIHPLVREEVGRLIAGMRASHVIVDVPLLFEAGWQDDFDRTVVVFADPVSCRRRIAARDQVSDAEAMRALRTQKPLFQKAMMADHVIDNSFCRLLTRLQLVHLAKVLSMGVGMGKK